LFNKKPPEQSTLLKGVTPHGAILELVLTTDDQIAICKNGKPLGLTYEQSCLNEVTKLFTSMCMPCPNHPKK
jgi:hypothetical protein